MQKPLLAILLCMVSVFAFASGAKVHLEHANIDPHNKSSLQRGAKTFVNYCLGCHSAAYQRYGRLAADLGIPEEDVLENLMFTGEKIGDHMKISATRSDLKKWFGAAPPDLTLVARVRGEDWLYTFLKSFHLDSKRPFGVNNSIFPNVGMPHVLWELQGWQEPVFKTEVDHQGHEHQSLESLELVEQGSLNPAEYDKTIRDLVNFLAYMAEPIKQQRQALGIKVLLFLSLLFIITYLLKKEYWKDIH
ncbi:MAG: cytochrome c1 [Gammaproteobacteria bacterium]